MSQNTREIMAPCGSEDQVSPIPVVELEIVKLQPKEDGSNSSQQRQPIVIPGNLAVFMMTVALMSAIFLVALDVNILATAIPKITTEFHKLDDVSWYGVAYSLPKMALQPTYGRIYSSFSPKHVFCYALGIFGVGSIVCATSRSSEALIFGRATQGCGAAGAFSGCLLLCASVVPKPNLPSYIALLSTMFMVASLIGPVMGGALASSRLTWRFCFWLNLPIGAICIIITVFAFPGLDASSSKQTLKQKLGGLDPLSTMTLIGSICCLVLALQWGGTSLSWSSSKVWGCLVGFGTLLSLFIGLQIQRKERALIPFRILTQRSVAVGCIATAAYMIAMNTLTFYLPFYFQASRGLSPKASGIYILALAVPEGIAGIACGLAVTMTGLYIPFMVVSGAIMAIGASLITTLNPDSHLMSIVGYEIIASIGFGMGIQLPLTAIRNILADADVPFGNALVIFSQGLGTSLALSVAQTVFLTTLNAKLKVSFTEIESAHIVTLGAANVNSNYISPEAVPLVAAAYSHATRATFFLAVTAAGIVLTSSLLMDRKRLESVSKRSTNIGDDGVAT